MWAIAARVAGGLLTGVGAGKVLDMFGGKKEAPAPVAPAGYYGYSPAAAPAATLSLSMPLLLGMVAVAGVLVWMVFGKKRRGMR